MLESATAAAFFDELEKIALSSKQRKGYRKYRGALISNEIPTVKKLSKDPELAKQELVEAIHSAKPRTSIWSHAQVAVPLNKLPSKKREEMGFSSSRYSVIPLPGERWFTETWRSGRLHAHRRGPVYLVHQDAFPLKGVDALKHGIMDAPKALTRRLFDKPPLPVILKSDKGKPGARAD